MIIVDSLEEEEEERTEEDKEVENIIKKGQEAKRKILTGMSNMSDKVKISTSIILNICILYVTCCYYSSIPVTNEPHLASRESKSCLISGGDSS